MRALDTEYFVLQSTVLPTVFVLGWFTIVRLISVGGLPRRPQLKC
jgi:hypothetical protein